MKLIRRFIDKILNGIAQRIISNYNWEENNSILIARAIMSSKSWQDRNFEQIYSKGFRVFSQFDDDGIIQYLIHVLNLEKEGKFIEFGVGDFYESNSHFLLVNNNWSGFIIDGSESNVYRIQNSPIYWKFDINAIREFVTAENVNELLNKSGFNKINYLHVDLDGNDYWVLKSLNLEKFSPDILILEYNSHFGYEREISIPYDSKFYRTDAHFSNQYFGASLLALKNLAEEKGYYFIGCNSAGNNAYFLANEHKNKVKPMEIRDGFVNAKFRDSRNENGDLTYLSRNEAFKLIKGLPVYDFQKSAIDHI